MAVGDYKESTAAGPQRISSQSGKGGISLSAGFRRADEQYRDRIRGIAGDQ